MQERISEKIWYHRPPVNACQVSLEGKISACRTGQQQSLKYVSRLAGGCNVHAIYNATHGKMDLPECLIGLDYIATEPVRQLLKLSYACRKDFILLCGWKVRLEQVLLYKISKVFSSWA